MTSCFDHINVPLKLIPYQHPEYFNQISSVFNAGIELRDSLPCADGESVLAHLRGHDSSGTHILELTQYNMLGCVDAPNVKMAFICSIKACMSQPLPGSLTCSEHADDGKESQISNNVDGVLEPVDEEVCTPLTPFQRPLPPEAYMDYSSDDDKDKNVIDREMVKKILTETKKMINH